ncbi:MAG: hypothetical protein AB8C95_16190 [Phycisphaeraceae bacterium]
MNRSLLLLVALLIGLPSAAQTMIEKVPDSAVMYVGWRGSTDMGPGYEGSNLQGMLEELGLLEAVPEMVDLIDKLGEDGQIEEDEAQMLALAGTLLSAAWADGGAMYVLPPEAQGPPIPRLCVMMNKGKDPAKVRDAINTIVAILGEQMPTFSGDLGDGMFLSVGFNASEMEFESLAKSARFTTAAKQVQGDAAVMVYMDAKAWLKQVDDFTAMMRDQAAQQERPADPFVQLWPTIRESTGLDGVDSLAMTAGIKDKNWHTRLFLGAPTPRRGLLSLLDNEPITAANLMHVPKTASYMQAFSMQPSRVLDVTMDIASSIDENIVKSIQEVLKDASKEVGFDIEMKLIRGMGPAWTVYVDPMIAGNGFASIVMVNELQDPKSVEQAMAQLSSKANVMMSQEDDVKIRFLTQEVGGAAITHLGVPFIAPAWTVYKGKLYVSFYPQALEMAVAQSGKREDSILANDAFQTAMGRFLDRPAAPGRAFDSLRPITGLSFSDLPKTAAEGYGTTMMLMQAISGASEMFTGEASSMRMPPVGKLMPFLEVAGGITRVDVNGLHIHSIEPFPGASALSASKGMTAGAGLTAPMSVAILLPALGSARESARSVQTLTQARQISMANFAYAADNEGKFADDIAKLGDYVGDHESFISARTHQAQPMIDNFDALPEAQRAKHVRQHSSFVLIPLGDQGQVQNNGDTIMLFERPDHTDATELAVTMADGSAMTMPVEELTKALQKQTGQSIEQLIQQQKTAGE